MMNTNYKRLLFTGAVSVFLLAGCHKKQENNGPQKTPKSQAPIAIQDQTTSDAQDFSAALRTRPKSGGVLSISPRTLLTDVPYGGSITKTITLTNEGDDTMHLKSILAQGNPEGLNLAGTCSKPNIALLPAQSCDIQVHYKDSTGENLNTVVAISTDSKKNQISKFDVGISVENTQGNQLSDYGDNYNKGKKTEHRQDQPLSAQEAAYAAALYNAQQGRYTGGSSQQQNDPFAKATLSKGMQEQEKEGPSQLNIQPIVGIRTQEARYNPSQIPWTQTTLKVNRKYMLTADRIIPAVLSSPISALMCNVVRATVDQNVYSPDSNNILIPAGTHALGHCGSFTDERLNIQWYRLITPDGVNITFNKLQADTSDAMGRGGVAGRVQQKEFDRYAAPIFESVIDIGSSVARAIMGQNQQTSYNNLSGQQSNSESKYDSAIDDFNNRARRTIIAGIQTLLDQRRNVIVQAGTRIEINPQEDIYFKQPSQIITLADYEYEIQQQANQPQAMEMPAPTLAITPQITDGSQGSQTVVVNGKTYDIGTATIEKNGTVVAAGINSSTGMKPNSAAQGSTNKSFYNGDPTYADPSTFSTRGGVSSNFGGISNLNQNLAAGYSGPGGSNDLEGSRGGGGGGSQFGAGNSSSQSTGGSGGY